MTSPLMVYLGRLISHGVMEYCGSNADDGLGLFNALHPSYKNRSNSTNPILHYSTTPTHSYTAQPIFSDLARWTRFSKPGYQSHYAAYIAGSALRKSTVLRFGCNLECGCQAVVHKNGLVVAQFKDTC